MRGMAGAQKLLGSCDLQQSVGDYKVMAPGRRFSASSRPFSTLKGASPGTFRCFKALRAEVCPDTIVILVIRPNVSPERLEPARSLIEASVQ